jgi:hypothetical protein
MKQIMTVTVGVRRKAAAAALMFVLTLLAAASVHTASGLIYVDDNAAAGGDRSVSRPYNNLKDAFAAARTAAGAVVVQVAPGVYPVDASLVIDRPMTVRGASVLVQGTDGWPTGDVVPGSETRITGSPLLNADPLISVGRADGVIVSGVTIGGFAFQGTDDGIEVYIARVQRFVVQKNVFRAPASLGMQSVASTGVASGNYFSGAGTGAIFTGGYPASPSNVTFTGNRSTANTLGGVLLNGASIGIPELGDQLYTVVRNNDLSGNTATPNFSFGLRLYILRRDLGAPGDLQSEGNIHAVVQNNRIVGNEMGLSIDAGFPYRSVTTSTGST